MNKWYPEGDKNDQLNAYGPTQAGVVVHVLQSCGDELTRENVMKQAANIHGLDLPMLMPGITINTSPNDFAPIKQVQMARFNGDRWELFGPILTGAVG